MSDPRTHHEYLEDLAQHWPGDEQDEFEAEEEADYETE
jgi:hypothetical protein